MKTNILVAVILIVSQISFASTESNSHSPTPASTPDDSLQQFIGTWKGEGKVTGFEAKTLLTWENALGGKFFRLSYRNEMKNKAGTIQLFEGVAYYKATGGQKYQATWFDSGGEVHPIDAQFEANTLNSHWGTDATKLGRTIYRLVTDKKMEVVDSVRLKDGTWKEFGRVVYVRIG